MFSLTGDVGRVLPPPHPRRSWRGGSQRPPGGRGLLPRDGIRQPHTRPQPVDHGQVRERAAVEGPRRAMLGDEGCVAISQAGRSLAQTLHLPQEIFQPAQQPVGERRSAMLHASSPRAKGFMWESPLRRRGPSGREAIMGNRRTWCPYRRRPWDPARRPSHTCGLLGGRHPARGNPFLPSWPWQCRPAWRGR